MAVAKDFQSLTMPQKYQIPRTAVQSVENKGKSNIWRGERFALKPKICEFKEVSFSLKSFLV